MLISSRILMKYHIRRSLKSQALFGTRIVCVKGICCLKFENNIKGLTDIDTHRYLDDILKAYISCC